jgi:hypothetical protein
MAFTDKIPYKSLKGKVERKDYHTYIEKPFTLPDGVKRLRVDFFYNGKKQRIEAHYDPLNDILYIRSQNSDGAGAYDVVWRVVKGIYTDRDIVYGF